MYCIMLFIIAVMEWVIHGSSLRIKPFRLLKENSVHVYQQSKCCWSYCFKDVCAHCYCASLLRTLFIGHARATSFSSARTDSKTQQNIERMTFALTWCANIFVGCSVTPTFFSADHFLSWLFSSYQKTKKICVWEVLIISHILLKKGWIGTWIQVCVTYKLYFLRLIVADLMTYVAKIYQIGLYKPC